MTEFIVHLISLCTFTHVNHFVLKSIAVDNMLIFTIYSENGLHFPILRRETRKLEIKCLTLFSSILREICSGDFFDIQV